MSALTAGLAFLQIVGKTGHFLGRNAQHFRRMLPDGRHDFLVQISNEIFRFFLQAVGCLRNALVHARRRFVHLAVETAHAKPSISLLRTAPVDCGSKQHNYFLPSNEGQPVRRT